MKVLALQGPLKKKDLEAKTKLTRIVLQQHEVLLVDMKLVRVQTRTTELSESAYSITPKGIRVLSYFEELSEKSVIAQRHRV